jgi:nucleoside-diphosphate-sugar epimerase
MQQAKIAVAGATGRLGRHVVDVLSAAGHEAVPVSRSAGVDVITGDGLAARAAESAGAPIPELAGPLEENLARLARLVAARRGDQVRIEEVKAADPDSEAAANGSLLPGPHARLAGPTFEEWLATQPDSGSAA